ncbi:hypothetical protein E8E13_003420 [Curvularia kusanoi]|uniref:RING-type domain-containing protein n=1 Tax=Curvularia kusanoi TaxID=90978 RepID=A0A9P4TIC4_CURKU|nr:hypothetical protein E8E13_003420 [Curvularia kusanoi]
MPRHIPRDLHLPMAGRPTDFRGFPTNHRVQQFGTTRENHTVPAVLQPGHGLVRERIQVFENRIAGHHYEPDKVYIEHAFSNMIFLRSRKLSYKYALQTAEKMTLFNIPEQLIDFLRDHDNLYRAAVRNRVAARQAILSPTMDDVDRVKHRLNNIRTACHFNLLEAEGSWDEARRLHSDPDIKNEFKECVELLLKEAVKELARLDLITPSSLELSRMDNNEYVNVGPDHNLDDFGHQNPVPSTTPFPDNNSSSDPCFICLEPFDSDHPPFLITACNHTFGKPCLEAWVNGTSVNANQCPYCRTPLCKRRKRVPATAHMTPEQQDCNARIYRVEKMVNTFTMIRKELWGPEEARKYTCWVLDELNWRLFQNDIGFKVHHNRRGKWSIMRVSWHGDD